MVLLRELIQLMSITPALGSYWKQVPRSSGFTEPSDKYNGAQRSFWRLKRGGADGRKYQEKKMLLRFEPAVSGQVHYKYRKYWRKGKTALGEEWRQL